MAVRYIVVDSVRSPIHPDHRDEKTYQVEIEGKAIGLITERWFEFVGSRGASCIRFWIPTYFDRQVIRSIHGYPETRREATLALVRELLGEEKWDQARRSL